MRPLDLLRLLALAAIWGASFLFLRIIAPVLGTFPTAFFRVLLGTAGLLVILVLMRTRWDFQRGDGLNSEMVAFASQAGAMLCLLPLFGLSLLQAPPRSWGDQTVWLSLLGLGLVCTAFAYILYFRLLADIGPVRTLTVTFLIPPFGVLWGVLLLDEPLSWAYVQGGALIALALWLILRPGTPLQPRTDLRRG